MRIRVAFTTIAIAVFLAACGGENQPAEHQVTPDTVSPNSLRTKLDAQRQDPCFETPGKIAPQDCRKYVTQISNIANSVRRIEQDDRALHEAAQTIDKGIENYRSNDCPSTGQPTRACTKALSTAADGLQTAYDTLDTGGN